MYVQYGSGFSGPEGWVNFDASPTLRFERIPVIGKMYTRNSQRFPPNVQYGDIVAGLPVTAKSVDGLYASHVLEHLSLEACRQALRNSFLVLKAGGTFRLIVPDLKARAEQYLLSQEPEAGHEFLMSTFLGRINKRKGMLGRFLETLSNSDHLWMYDESSMRMELARAGFISIRRCTIGDSADRMFDRVENEERFFDKEIVELAMECKTPG